ncbi:TRADD-N-associated membrane domain-containing protein [Nocardia fluminea]|uniref:TRADD-N-associated membrane domain-containing protein n=1 Tax=Nocardia fluminea TaxID=134984 RepID=UPI003D0AE10E
MTYATPVPVDARQEADEPSESNTPVRPQPGSDDPAYADYFDQTPKVIVLRDGDDRTRKLIAVKYIRVLSPILLILTWLSIIVWDYFTSESVFGPDLDYRLITLSLLALLATGIVITGVSLMVEQSIRYQYATQVAEERAIEAIGDVKDADDLHGLSVANARQMEAYDKQVRGHGAGAFRASLFAMLGGLAIIGAGFGFALYNDDPATKYAAAIISAAATATGGYIARTFISVQRDTQDQMRYYFQQPLVQSYLLTAERLVTQLPDEQRAEQLKEVIAAAIAQASSVGPTQTPTAAQAKKPRARAPRRTQTGLPAAP